MKNIFITGATSGIGFVTACELASHGNNIIATSRSIEKGNELLLHYKNQYPDGIGAIEIVLCDLSSFDSIVYACQKVKANYHSIDVVINNAGVWNFNYKETKNKIEETFQVNVLAPLLINYLLIEPLLRSNDAKSIFAASALHQGHVNLFNLEFKNKFSSYKAYRQSKLEVILLCRILAKKLEDVGIGVYCEHPGFVSTELGRNANWFSSLIFRVFGISPAKGAETLIYLAEEDKSALVSGEYYTKKAVKKITAQSYDLKVAENLLKKLNFYLKEYTGAPSLIFDTH
jgi:NAD(P)-dependent dehydrogenase (short-subunit alcohol dehydrogenase family)